MSLLMLYRDLLWKKPESWKPKTTPVELKEFLTSNVWNDMLDLLTMQQNGMGKEILNDATTMEDIWKLRGRSNFASFIKTFPNYIGSMHTIDERNIKLKKEREKENE